MAGQNECNGNPLYCICYTVLKCKQPDNMNDTASPGNHPHVKLPLKNADGRRKNMMDHAYFLTKCTSGLIVPKSHSDLEILLL
uniref:Uncharacterized protein n=1 Tax=Romanomermis culicivorax TaxID=13658 RepID=A0A915KFG3_ROMCU